MQITGLNAALNARTPVAACSTCPGHESADRVSVGERPPELTRVSIGQLAARQGKDLIGLLDEAISAVHAAPLSALDEQRLSKLSHDIPKVDLHRHLEGSIEPEVLISVAQKHNIPLPSYNVDELRPHIQITPNDKTLLDFLKKFDVIGGVFKDKEVISDLTHGAIADAHKDNVKYLEFRFSPQYMAKAHNLDVEDVLKGVFDGVQRGANDFDTKVNLTLIVERWDSHDRAREVADLAARHQDKGIVALDLANDEYNFPPGPFAQIFQDAKKAGLKITVHSGEAGPADNVRVSIEQLGADRIGHGVRAYTDPSLVQLAADRKIPFEMCPTSNEQTQTVENMDNYPFEPFYRAGVPVTANTDDPSISGITLSDEVAKIAKMTTLSLNDIRQIEQNGIDYGFTSEANKRELTATFDQGFAAATRSLVESMTVDELRDFAHTGIDASPGTDAEKQARRQRLEQELKFLTQE